jgi:hypothetical protein
MQAFDDTRTERVTHGVAVIHPRRTRQLAQTDGRFVARTLTGTMTRLLWAPPFGARRQSSNVVTRVRLGRAARPQTGAAYG